MQTEFKMVYSFRQTAFSTKCLAPIFFDISGWLGSVMALGKLPMSERPKIWKIVRHGPIVLGHFYSPLSFLFSFSLFERAVKPKTTNQSTNLSYKRILWDINGPVIKSWLCKDCSKINVSVVLFHANHAMCSQNHLVIYAHGRRLYSNWARHGSTTISYPQCSLTSMRERYLHRSFAYAKSTVGIDVVSVHKLFAYRVVSTVSTDIVSSHTKYCRIAYGVTR